MTTGIKQIAAERRRQIEAEGFTPEHDDQHDDGELQMAADCYRRAAMGLHLPRYSNGVPVRWPWADEWWKAGRSSRELVKAGALYMAEIERLTRLRDSCAAELDKLQRKPDAQEASA